MVTAKNEGLDVVALTDHDTTAGWDEAREACSNLGMTFVPGVEMSASLYGHSIHVLGYLVDPDNDDFAAECSKTRDDRVARFEAMVERIHEDHGGMTVEFAYSFHRDGATLGRPTIARALVDLGIVSSVDEAFSGILAPDNREYYVGHYAPTVSTAVEVISKAGGVAVLAHPWTSTRASLGGFEERGIDPRAYLQSLVDVGLAGLEVHHSENTPHGKEQLLQFAAEFDLIVTGSSDYHGPGMKPILPGAHLTSEANFERILARGSGQRVVRAQ
jgi:predicted metal-dependent phosphoesterase TrpH